MRLVAFLCIESGPITPNNGGPQLQSRFQHYADIIRSFGDDYWPVTQAKLLIWFSVMVDGGVDTADNYCSSIIAWAKRNIGYTLFVSCTLSEFEYVNTIIHGCRSSGIFDHEQADPKSLSDINLCFPNIHHNMTTHRGAPIPPFPFSLLT